MRRPRAGTGDHRSLIMEDREAQHQRALQGDPAMGVPSPSDDFRLPASPRSATCSKLPVDTLKIDRSFVIDMTGAPEGLAWCPPSSTWRMR
jgi:predicted signal transduction protein with EAL and GGDEF domain